MRELYRVLSVSLTQEADNVVPSHSWRCAPTYHNRDVAHMDLQTDDGASVKISFSATVGSPAHARVMILFQRALSAVKSGGLLSVDL